MKFIVWILLIVSLNVAQILLRERLDFYPDNVVVSIIIGSLIGVFSTLIVLLLE